MKKTYQIGAMVSIAILILAVMFGFAEQQDAAQGDGGAMTQQQIQELLLELKTLHKLLGSQHRAQPVETRVPDTGYSLGRKDAALTLVEFSDYQCPFCAEFQNVSFAKLQQEFVKTGKVRLVIRDLPLAAHSNALKAAEAARCGGEQGEFWEMRDALVSRYNDLDETSMLADAHRLRLNMRRFRRCMDTNRFLPEIQRDLADAKAAGITATPSFVLGKADKGMVNGVLLVGALPFNQLSEQIDKKLGDSTQTTGKTTAMAGDATPAVLLQTRLAR